VLRSVALVANLLLLAAMALLLLTRWPKLSPPQRRILALIALALTLRPVALLLLPSSFPVLTPPCAWPQLLWVQFYLIVSAAGVLVLRHVTSFLRSDPMLKIAKQTSIAYAAVAVAATALSAAFAAAPSRLLLLLSRLALLPLIVALLTSAVRMAFIVRKARSEAKELVGRGMGPTDPAVSGYRKIGRNVNLFAATMVGGSLSLVVLAAVVVTNERTVDSLTLEGVIGFVNLAVMGLVSKVTFALTSPRRVKYAGEGGGSFLRGPSSDGEAGGEAVGVRF
jgi:hypothetical protein